MPIAEMLTLLVISCPVVTKDFEGACKKYNLYAEGPRAECPMMVDRIVEHENNKGNKLIIVTCKEKKIK